MTDQQDASPDEHRTPPSRLMPALPTKREPSSELEGYNVGASPEPGEFRSLVFDYLRIFYKRRWLVAAVLMAFVILGTTRALLTTPLYTATVRLQIDRSAAKIVEGGNVAPTEGAYDFDFLRTQYELLQSRAIAERVASALKLGEDADLFRPREFSLIASLKGLFASQPAPDANVPSKSALERAAAGIVLGNRAVRPVSGSRLVDVSYSDPAPARAQRIATALAEAFIASNLDKRFEANAYAKTFLEDQLQQLKLRLEESEKGLLEFAQREQIVATNEKSSIAESNLASANAALGNLVSERIKNEQLWKQVAAADAINLPQLLSNKVIDALREKRNALVTEYQEKLETFKPSYPAMLQISNKIKEIDRQLTGEVKTIKDAYKAAYEASANEQKQMESRIETLRTEMLELQKRSIQYNIVKREVDTTRSLYEGLLQRYKEVDVAGGVGANNVFIVDRAELPGGPSSPLLSRAFILSFGLGLGAGLAAAFVVERLDDTLTSAEEVERISGLAMLGTIPKVEGRKTVETELSEPRSALSEAYRSLCTALQFSTDAGLPKTLLVTSTGPAEGKSITTIAVAKHFATMGLKVLMVDADLRNPSLHSRLGLDNATGLSNYLTGSCTPPEVLQATSIANLAFMASGPLPPNAADLLGSSRLLSMLSLALEVFDLVVLDGPPVMGLADAPLLSNAAAATVFIVGAGQVRSGPVRGALKRLQFSRSPVIGAVLTKYDAKLAGDPYGYGYGYGYSRTEEEHSRVGRVGERLAHLARVSARA